MVRKLARIAALAVGEGKAEMELLRHIKVLYLPRGCGVTMRIQGNIGKGGAGVLEYTRRCSRDLQYDRRIAVLDTDTDWGRAERAQAASEGITVIESAPCLEVWLLAVHGIWTPGPSEHAKARFLREFGCPAHDSKIYPRHFRREVLDAARGRVSTLDTLLRALDQ